MHGRQPVGCHYLLCVKSFADSIAVDLATAFAGLAELLAKAVGKELGMKPERTLKKLRNNPPQSGMKDFSARRANVLGVYRVIDPENLRGKRVLLLDDIITTGATVSECARTLLTAGAKEVYCVAVAANKEKRR